MLVPLSEIKLYLGVTGTDDDVFLTLQGQIASDAVELYCRRKFALSTYEETFYKDDFRPTKSIKLYHYPLTELTSIKVDGEDLEDPVARVYKEAAMIYWPKGFFMRGVETVVTYKAGYAIIPALIQNVILSIVEERYNKKKSGVPVNFGNNVQRMSIPGTISIDFDYSLTTNEENSELGTILGVYQNILVPYRSERTVLGTGRAVFIA